MSSFNPTLRLAEGGFNIYINIARMNTCSDEIQDVSMVVEGVEISGVDYSSVIKESTDIENPTLPDPFESFLHTQGADYCELPPRKRKRCTPVFV